jgi:hypothetical protein
MSTAESTNPIKTAAEIEKTPKGVVARWLAELELASNSEKDWRKDAEEVWKLYQSKNKNSKAFNILWSNTETMRPATYNSTPKADVRRRFRDSDPVGKAASQVIERSLTSLIDAYDFDNVMQMVVLDVLLPGRGLARVKYQPKFGATGRVVDERAECEHVQWGDFRRGPGKTWREVPWEAFRHEFMYDQLVSMFGKEKADKIEMQDSGDLDEKHDAEVRSLLKVAEVWEIWDKATKRVIFLTEGYKSGPLLIADDPLELQEFFPNPRPCYAIEDSTSLIPEMLYEKYKPQAEELNRITARITKIVEALKVRGVYAGHLNEIAQVLEAEDNQMIPIQNASEIANMKGVENAIWIMPIDKLIQVLEGLMEARNSTIQAIYEITGLSDIMRGASNPHETLGAQQIKTQWGSLRLQRLQREVQRFIRDILRLKAEIIGEHFDIETLQMLTSMRLPTEQEKQQAQQALQQAQMQQQAQQQTQPGQPPQPQVPQQPQPPDIDVEGLQTLLKLPTWDEVHELLSSDAMRQYRIDIETDSTIEETLMRDAQGMQEAVTAIVNLGAGIGPAIQQGILSVDVFKSLAAAVARTVRMGGAVEDAIDQIQQPPPQPPQQDSSVDVAKVKAESDQKIAAGKQQADAMSKQMQMQSDQKLAEMQAQLDAALEQQKQQWEQQKEEMKAQLQQFKIVEDNKTKEKIAAHKTMTDAATAADKARVDASAQIETNERNAQATEESTRVQADASTIAAAMEADASRDRESTKADASRDKAKTDSNAKISIAKTKPKGDTKK